MSEVVPVGVGSVLQSGREPEEGFGSPSPRALSVYVHIPFCLSKCPYCDFNSYAATSWPEGAYVEALRRELAGYATSESWRERAVSSVFFGGGTPSLFAATSIAAVLEEIRSLWVIASDVEVTIEANPGTVSADSLKDLRSTGINRVSFGVQSFLPHHLGQLGRIHDAEQARKAVTWARAAGFSSVNVDLIYALPRQTVEEWRYDLGEAVALRPDHVSAYNLTYEEGTAFHAWRSQGRLHQLDEDVEIAMLNVAEEILEGAGLGRYEISNYSAPGQECRHNLNYWGAGAYVGVGAGAHGYSGYDQGAFGLRWGNEKAPARYMRSVAQHGHARATEEVLEARQAQGEFVFLGLRCLKGISESEFLTRFDTPIDEAFGQIERFIEDGLLLRDRGLLKLTRRGLLVADSIFASFL